MSKEEDIEYRVTRTLNQCKDRLIEIEAEFLDKKTTNLVRGRLLREYTSIILLGLSNIFPASELIKFVAPFLFDSFVIEDSQFQDESENLISRYKKIMGFLLKKYNIPENFITKH